MKSTVKLTVEGRVQGVGYRALVNQMAKKLKLRGYVKNLENGSVEIVCQGEQSIIENFKKEIYIKSKKEGPFNLHIDGIIENPIHVDGELKFFHIDYGEEAKTPFERTNLERLEIGSLILANVRDNVDNVGQKVDNLREDTNKNFNALDGKYGDITKNIIKMDSSVSNLIEELVKSNNNNTELMK